MSKRRIHLVKVQKKREPSHLTEPKLIPQAEHSLLQPVAPQLISRTLVNRKGMLPTELLRLQRIVGRSMGNEAAEKPG